MSVTKITLAKEDNNGVEYYYPKTTADIVEYTEDQSVKDKLDSLGSIEKEIREARVAMTDSEVKDNLKTRIDTDYNTLVNKIDNINMDNLTGILPIDKGGTNASTAPIALYNLLFRSPDKAGLDLDTFINNEHMGYWYFGSQYYPINAPVNNTTGYLIVLRGGGSLRKQIWMNQGNSSNYYKVYTRTYNGTNWLQWIKISDEKDLQNLYEEINNLRTEFENYINNISINDLNGVLSIDKGGTNASTAPIALYNLTYHSPSQSGLDLDTFINNEHMGYWYFGSQYYPINAPVNNTTGYLVVIRGGGSLRKQIWMNQGNSSNYYEIYTRTYNGTNWLAWVKIATKVDIDKLEQKITDLAEDMSDIDEVQTTIDEIQTKINNVRKVALVGSDLADQTGWHLVAEGSLSGNSNASFIFAVHDTKSYNSGILALDLRCASDSITYKNLGWLARSGFSLNDFGIQTYTNNTWRLFCKVNQQYYRVVFEVIEASGTASKDPNYTLYSNQSVYDNTGTPKSSVDLYIPYGRKANTDAGSYSTAIGSNNTASGGYSTAIGNSNIAPSSYSTAIGNSNTASGGYSTTIGNGNTSSNIYATAIGLNNNNGSQYSTTIGYNNTIDENSNYSYTNGYSNNIEYSTNAYIFGNNNSITGATSDRSDQSYIFGYNNSISGSIDSICIGRKNEIANTAYCVAIGFQNKVTENNGNAYKYLMGTNLSTLAYGSFACGSHNITRPPSYGGIFADDDTMFTVGCGTSSTDKGNAFRVLRGGTVYSTGAYNTSGADYAEFIEEWHDGNPDNEDRVGYMVTVKDGKLYKANEGDYIIGITSGNPSIVGNSDEEYYWRYERDKFNRIIYEDAEIEQIKVDDDGNTITEKISARIKKQSSNYNPELQTSYVSRVMRPEWDYVGMRGILPCRDDGTCIPGQFCKCGIDGIATKADNRGFDTYYVLKRIDEETISIEVK